MDASRPKPPLRGNDIFRRLKIEVFDAQDPSAIFPAVSTPPEVVAARLHDRLVALAQSYTDADTQDLESASLYSHLALTLYPESVLARKCRAQAFLLAGQGAVFPFTPHRSQRGGAAAALAVLEQGPSDVFADIECAQIWAQACRVLGRDKEAEEVLTWSLQGRSKIASTSAAGSKMPSISKPTPPALTTPNQRKEAIALIELADLHKGSRKYAQAEKHIHEARQRDPWNWRAWIRLCEIGVAPIEHAAFEDRLARHSPQSFLDSAILALGGDPTNLPEARAAAVAHDSQSAEITSCTAQTAAPQSSAEQPPMTCSTRDAVHTTSQHPRPGSRPTTSQDAGGAPTAKRTKSLTSRSAVGRNANGAALMTAQSAPMTRTLSQARTNERPPSSSSTASRSDGAPEKGKELAQSRATGVNVTKDSLRRSTRSQGGATASARTAATGTARRGGVARGNKRETEALAGGGFGDRSAPQQARNGAGTLRSTGTRSDANKSGTGLRQSRPMPTTTPSNAGHRATISGNGNTSHSVKGQTQPTTEDRVFDEVARNLRSSTLQKAADEASQWQAVDTEMLKCVRLLAGAYKDAKEYKGDRVLRAFSSHVESGLSEAHMRHLQESPELKVLFGRVHHDMAQYVEAEQCFQAATRASSDCWLADMDIYSLVLFHLSRQERLSALAQQLMVIDTQAAETHLAAGNLFSLNTSPSIALRSFRRACLSAPNYAHSYTLAGHECRALNQPLKALRFFREALRVDPRHWNGWSGIGMLLCSEGQWKEARTILAHACGLNPSNAQLWDVFGIASEQMNDRPAALEGYTKATLLNPKSAGATIRKAELLWKMNRLEAAHNALLRAIALSPNEAQVHLRLAQSYMRKGGGAFAPLSVTRPVGGEKFVEDSLTMGGKAKAMGESTLPSRYHSEVSRHLATAVDLEPSLSRRVRALAEGLGATLRGQAGNLSGKGSGLVSAGEGSGNAADRSVGSSFSGMEQSYGYDDETGYTYDDESAVAGGFMDEEEAVAVGLNGANDSLLGAEGMAGVRESSALDDSMDVLRDEDAEDNHEDDDMPYDEEEEAESELDEEEEDAEDVAEDEEQAAMYAEEDNVSEEEDTSADLVEASFAQTPAQQPHDQGGDEEAEMSLE